jgi:hypothetical protein
MTILHQVWNDTRLLIRLELVMGWMEYDEVEKYCMVYDINDLSTTSR